MKSVMKKVSAGYVLAIYEHYMFCYCHSVTRSQGSNHYTEANHYAHTHTVTDQLLFTESQALGLAVLLHIDRYF